MNRVRTDNVSTAAMAADLARYNDTILHDIRRSVGRWGQSWTRTKKTRCRSRSGAAARSMANHAGQDTEEMIITPGFMGLTGPNVKNHAPRSGTGGGGKARQPAGNGGMAGSMRRYRMR